MLPKLLLVTFKSVEYRENFSKLPNYHHSNKGYLVALSSDTVSTML